MAGFFGLFDYTRPGKGVDKNEPEKPPFIKFWLLVWRKLAKLIILNLTYLGFILPLLIAVQVFLAGAFMLDGEYVYLPILLQLFGFALDWPWPVTTALLAASVLFFGPLNCGMTYILRNYAREEHAWFSDLFSRMKSNFKQGLVCGLIDVLAVALVAFNAAAPSSVSGSNLESMFALSRYVSFAVFFVYLCMRETVYLQVVTVKLKLSRIYKNAFILSVIKLWRHLLSFVCVAALLILQLLHPLAELLISLLLFFSLSGFISVFINYPIIKQYLIDPVRKEEQTDV